MTQPRPQYWLLYVGMALLIIAQVAHAAKPWLDRMTQLDPSKPRAHFTGKWAFDHCGDMGPAANRQGAQQWSCADQR